MNELREAIQDVLAGWPIGSGYYSTAVGVDEAWEMADEVGAVMAEQITTAADLAALPDSSVISFRFSQHHREYAAIKRGGKWYLTGIFSADSCGYEAQELLDDGATGIAVLAPRNPVAATPCVKPSREDVAREIALGDDPTCPWPDGFTRMEEARAYRQADAVLALLPGRAVEEVKAEALEGVAKWFQIASRLGTGEPDALAAQACADAAARLRGESNG